MTVSVTRLSRMIFIALLIVFLSGVTGAFTTISYASDSIPPEEQSNPPLKTFSIEFQLGDNVVGEPPIQEDVEAGSSITLPGDDSFSKGNYTFIGWSDGQNLYSAGNLYQVNNDVVFTAQWEEEPQEAPEKLQGAPADSKYVIIGFDELKDVILSEDEQIINKDLLEEKGKLPSKLVLHTDGIESSTVEVDIINWQGEFIGTEIGSYILVPEWQLPEGYIKDEELTDLTIKVVVQTIQTDPDIVTIDYEPQDHYTVLGNKGKDIIEIVNFDEGVIQITISNEEGTKTYRLSNKTKIVINGDNGDDTIYLNLTKKSNGLAELVILGGAGQDTITTQLTKTDMMDLTEVDVLLKAEKVLFDIESQDQQKLNFKANNLVINAAPTEASKFYESQNIKVVFRNIDIDVTGDFTVDATTYISNGQEVEDGTGESTTYEIDIQDEESASDQIVDTIVDGMDETLKTVVNVATVSVEVELDTAKVSANNVSIKTTNDIEMKTGSGAIPVAVTVADLISNITVKGDSLINSVLDIMLNAYANIKATGDATSNTSIPLSVVLMVLGSNVGLSVTDTSKLIAGRDINLLAENNIDTMNLAYGGGNTQSGSFTAVTIVNQNTKATMDGKASAQASNLTVNSIQRCKTQTYAKSGDTAHESDDSEDEEGDIEEGGFSLKDILNIISNIKNPNTENNDEDNLVETETIEDIDNTFDNTTEGFQKDSENEPKDGASSQLVGAVGVIVANTKNEASIKATGQIKISEQISVLAQALSNHTLIADASTVEKDDEEDDDIPFGLGVGVAVGIVNYKNYSYIGRNSNITANSIQLKADTLDNMLSIGSKAGYNEGEFGIGGAVSVGIYSGETKAYIEDGSTIELTGDTGTSNISLVATDISITEIVADASSQDDGDIWDSVDEAKEDADKSAEQISEEDDEDDHSTGIGSGVAISIFDNDVIAHIGKVTIEGTTNDLIVEASSEGSNNTSAAAGAEGGICIVPVVAINMVNNYVRATIGLFSGSTLMVNGDVLVKASGIRETQTEANAEAGGEDVAVGAAVAIGLSDMLEEAILDRNIGSSNNRANSVAVIAIGVNSNEVTTYAGKNGGKEDSSQNDDEEDNDEEGSITDLFNRGINAINSIRGSRELPEKDTTETAKEQKAETSEGTLTFAASLALAVVDSTTISAIGKTVPVVIYTGDISIITSTNKDVIANANASATNGSESEAGSKVGIGAAAAIINVTTKNNAVLGKGSKVYATGNGYMKTIMEEVEETTLDEEGKETTTTNVEHNYGVAAQSGAGGSVLSLAGAVAISIIDSDFLVSVDGTLEAEGKIDMEADAAQYVQTIATALPVKTIAGKNAKKRRNNNTVPAGQQNGGVGIGASFAFANINTSVSVKSAHGAVLKSGRELKVKSSFTNRVTTVAESGEDVIDDDEDDEDKLDEDYSELNSKYNKTALDAAVAISIIDITVETVIGAPQNIDVPNIVVGKDLVLEAELNSIIKTTSKSIVEATNAAAGATLSLNIIEGIVIADMAGYAQVLGKVVITAKANTVDESDAYATAKGVQLKRQERKFGTTTDDILDGKTGDDTSKLPASQKVLNNEDISKYTETTNVDQNNGNTSSGAKISVAAAVAVSIIEHNVIASISGKIINAASIDVVANNENNFMAYATGASVNNGNAISVAVAVVVNNSKTHAILGSAEDIKGDISVESNTLHNLSEGYENKISAQAIAGSKAGKDGKFGAAGAVAVLVSNAQTMAYISDHVSISTDKNISIEAKEKSKLAIRAWGATLITNTSDVKDQMGSSSGTTAGIGAAFAILHANNQIIAYIGNGSSIMAKYIGIASIKEKVDYSDYAFSWDGLKDVLPTVDELKDAFSQKSDDKSTSISVDAEAIKKIVDGLNGMDIALTAAEYMNLVASNNYYVEAAGGSIASASSDTKFSGAGSFAIMYFRNIINAFIGDGVTITILPGTNKENSIEIIAKSDINVKAIGGSVATGGDTSAGLTAVVIYNEDEINAYIGKDASISGFDKGINIGAEALQDYVIIAVGASAADKNGIAGIVNGIFSNNSVKAYIDSSDGINKIQGSGNLTIEAVNDTDILGILGGLMI